MKKLYVAMFLGIAALFGLSLWKNWYSYGYKTWKWRAGKSAIDVTLIVLAALYLPALLVGWSVMWMTRNIARRGVQITLAVLLGVLFSTIGGVALEILCILGIFSVDLLTGQQGVYGWFKQQIPETFLPQLETRNDVARG